MAKQELLATIRDRYQTSSRKDKSRILDEFVAVIGHRSSPQTWHQTTGQSEDGNGKAGVVKGRRIYDEAVGEAVILVWEASDRICGKTVESSVAPLGGVHGAPWPPGSGPRGAEAIAGRQCGHAGQVAETRSRQGGQPAQTPT